MSLGDDVRISEVHCGLKGANTEQVLKNLSWKVSKGTGLVSTKVLSELERISKEKSGIGDGIAVFDWMDPSLETPYVLLVRLENPIGMRSVDDRLIDFVLVLVSPETQSITHLRHLSRLTRLFREESLMDKLRSADCEDGMVSLLSPENREILAA